ncbi:YhdP family protein [Delftia acidovorans]|uniref:YhdP family protein n=1 Tax=Delftia acidovorans TaxID=80866 RepID=UPI0035A0653D
MIEPKPHPTRLTRWMAGLARWSLGLVLAFWLVLGSVWGVLHGWIVPRIGEWRPQLESLASRTLGLPVRIGSITARSEGLVPRFELGDVVVEDPEHTADALRLPSVVVAVSARSLMRLGVEQIYIDRPELVVRRAADGRVFVAGIEISPSSGGDNAAADWLFSQTELALRGGSLLWVDEMRQAPPLALRDVDLVLRNKGWSHGMRLDATPPEGWGERFMLAGLFREPLLSTHEGNWQRWSGQAHAMFTQIDLSRLGQYMDTSDLRLQQGRGALRAWIDLRQGQPVGAMADVAVNALQLQWRENLEPLQLQALTGRLSVQHQDGWRFAAQNLEFSTGDGLHWPAGNLRARYNPAGASTQGALGEQGEFQADGIDLAILAQLGQRLPLPEQLQRHLADMAPTGQLRQFQGSWRGPLQAVQQYKASGELQQLSIDGVASSEGPTKPGMPGIKGLNARFSLDQDGGQAQLEMEGTGQQPAALSFPGVFEQPEIPLHRLQASLRWQLRGQAISVQVPNLRFANDDTEGEARAQWHTGDGSDKHPRFPGVLDLQGQLRNADGTRVHRYLPLEIPADARHYVREAIHAGRASTVNFKVRGHLDHVPAEKPSQGEFHIAAKLHDVHYEYVPPHLLTHGEAPWPALVDLSGELVFDRSSMAVRNARGEFAGYPQLQMRDIQASIPNLGHTEVAVTAKGQGPLADMLGVVKTSALSALTGHVLDGSEATGAAQLALQLQLPIDHLDRSKVSGQVTLAGNSLQLDDQTPHLSQLRGAVKFSETGFSLAGLQARALGGELRADGGMQALARNAPATESSVKVRVQGTATAQGLREARELGWVADLARHAEGQSPYSLLLKVRRGTPEIQVQSSLQGMRINLPAPLGKAAESIQPLNVSHQLAPASFTSPDAPLRDQISVQLGDTGSVFYERDISGKHSRVLHGSILIGQEAGTASTSGQGVQAHVQLPLFNLDDWLALAPQSSGAKPEPADAADPAREYLPDRLTLRVKQLQAKGRQLHDVVAGISRDGGSWHSNLTSQELDGYVGFREGTDAQPEGQLVARLSRLTVPEAKSDRVDALFSEGPRQLPALQIVVDDMHLSGHALGRLEVEARNRPVPGNAAAREWQLSRFNIATPEATLTASGQWRLPQGQSEHPGRSQLQFQLDLRDVGKLLTRFDMPGVVGNGKGVLQGSAGWTGSPITPDFRSLSGSMHLDVQTGQFLKAEPGLAKLLSVLSLQALPRRLTLDFRDVFSNGFAFDFMRGDVQITDGVARTNNMQMKGVNAAVLMEGTADLVQETQNLHVVVVPEINAMTASLVATAINPVVGLGSFLAQVLLRGPLIAAATKEFRIDGSWDEPQVTALPRRRATTPSDPAANSPASTPSGATEPASSGENP